METPLILIDWGDRPDTRPPLKVVTRRGLLLPQDGTIQHVDGGTEITLAAAVLDGLSPGDYTLAPAD